jgi:alpha-tubulin suppressor-like RCC1 family protein
VTARVHVLWTVQNPHLRRVMYGEAQLKLPSSTVSREASDSKDLTTRPPRIVQFFSMNRAISGTRVIRVSCGSAHNVALTGAVMLQSVLCGKGERRGCAGCSMVGGGREMGRKVKERREKREERREKREERRDERGERAERIPRARDAVDSVLCYIADMHEVYTWGCGEDGRLGHETNISENDPRLVLKLIQHVVVDISAGGAHTVVVSCTFLVCVCVYVCECAQRLDRDPCPILSYVLRLFA